MRTGKSERSPNRQKLRGLKKTTPGRFSVQKSPGRRVPFQTGRGDNRHGQRAAGRAWVKALKHENVQRLEPESKEEHCERTSSYSEIQLRCPCPWRPRRNCRIGRGFPRHPCTVSRLTFGVLFLQTERTAESCTATPPRPASASTEMCSYSAGRPRLPSHQFHKAVVLFVLVGEVPDPADLFLPFAPFLLLLSPVFLLLPLLLQLPRSQLLLPYRLLRCGA